jgi:rRNA maturation RNase YbeY
MNIVIGTRAAGMPVFTAKELSAFRRVFSRFLASPKGCLPLWAHRGTAECEIELCGKARMRRLNKQYRGKDRPTDVLSFPAFDSFPVKRLPLLPLGDIVICPEVALKQANDFGVTPACEMARLLVHGFLHLCGYDHEKSSKEEATMFKIQERLLAEVMGKKQR